MLNNAMFNKPQNQQKNNHVPVFSMSLISLAIFSFHISAFAESLEQINVVDESPVNSTSGSKGYSIKSMNTATGLHIQGKIHLNQLVLLQENNLMIVQFILLKKL